MITNESGVRYKVFRLLSPISGLLSLPGQGLSLNHFCTWFKVEPIISLKRHYWIEWRLSSIIFVERTGSFVIIHKVPKGNAAYLAGVGSHRGHGWWERVYWKSCQYKCWSHNYLQRLPYPSPTFGFQSSSKDQWCQALHSSAQTERCSSISFSQKGWPITGGIGHCS